MRARTALRLALVVALVAALTGAAILHLATHGGDTHTPGALPLFDAAALRDDFNAARHGVRVVAILSPT